MTCLCSDTATILWHWAREHNKRSLRNSCPSISSSSILQHLDRAAALRDFTKVRILNRIVRWVKPQYGSGRDRIDYEAYPRHVELIIHQLVLSSSSRSVSAPSEKSQPGADHSTVLNSADHTLYRSATVRPCYLALDRPDLQLQSKELARWMQAPTVGNLDALKRVVRYMDGSFRSSCDKLRIRLMLWCSLTQITQVA